MKNKQSLKLYRKQMNILFLLAIIPVILVFVGTILLVGREKTEVKEKYGLSENQMQRDYILYDKVTLLSSATNSEYEDLLNIREHTPARILEKEEQERINASLKNKYSFLVLTGEDGVRYFGKEAYQSLISKEILTCGIRAIEGNAIFIEASGHAFLLKPIEFSKEKQERLSAFIVTDLDVSLPHIQRLTYGPYVFTIITLIIFCFVIVGYMYYHVIRPIQYLQIAVRHISTGDLEYELEEDSSADFKELYEDFEKMQKRLRKLVGEQERNNALTREVIGNISHDLKTPLTAIKGYAEGIIDGIAGTPERTDKYVRTIYAKATDMTQLVDELAFFTSINRDDVLYNYSVVSVNRYISDCIGDVSLDLEMKDINLVFCSHIENGVKFKIDIDKVRRVINNLIGNAAKYTNHKQGVVRVTIEEDKKYVTIGVEDNGAGIAEEELPFIFDRFYRTDSSRNSTTGGSGLGLAIAKKIVEDHDGKIWAKSIKDLGTKIMFKLEKFRG